MLRSVWVGLMLVLGWNSVLAQSKIDVSVSLPSAFHVCLSSDDLSFTVRNITTSTVGNIEMRIELPAGVEYISGSLTGTGITEKNITDLNKPIFAFPSLGLAQASVLKIKVDVSCSITNLINSGGLAVAKTTTTYTGGSLNVNSSPWNVLQPSVQIQSITNQLKTADVGEVFVRTITIRNSGTGKLPGLVFRQIHQNGLQLVGTSTTIFQQSGDTVWQRIDSAAISQVGNGDRYLDLNESVVIHDTIKVIACSNLRAFYRLGWGCQGAICASYNSSANVTISTRSANLVYTVNSTYSNCFSSGTAHPQEIIIYNNGNDTARELDFHIFQAWNTGFYNQRILSQMDYTSFTYRRGQNASATSITPYKASTTSNSGFYSCLGSTPVGEVYLDLPAMAPGDSLILHWTTRSCCPTGCNISGAYAHRWKYESTFENQCGTSIQSGEQWGNGGTYQSMAFSKFIPSDIRDGEEVTLEYAMTSGNLFRPINRSQLRVELILANGLSHSKDASDLAFIHPNGTSWYPQRFEQNGDTIWAIFRGPPTVTMVRSELLVNLLGSCGSLTTNGQLNYQLNINYNPDTSCTDNCWMSVYCDQDDIKLHCATTCSAGLHFNDFKAQRTNFGLPDNNNDGLPDASGSLDMDRVKDNRVMYGDTLLTTFRAKVYNAGSTTNWYHGKATSRLNYGRYLSVADVRIKIYRAGNLLFNCNNINYSVSSAGNAKTFTFDIGYTNLVNSGCVLYSTFSYLSVDSIELEVTYVVDQDPGNGLRVLEIENDFYLSTVANPSASQKYQCDSFSAKINLIGSYFTNWGRNVITNSGCADFTTYQSYYLSIGACCANYAGGNIFPYEYRAFAKLHGVLIRKLPGFDLQHTRLYHYRTAGTGSIARQDVDTLISAGVQNGYVFFPTDSLFEDVGGDLKISDDGFHGTIGTTLLANCRATTDNHELEYGFIFQRLNTLGSGLDTLFSGLQGDRVTYTKAEFDLVAQNTDVYAISDTVEWEVRVSNTTTGANADNVWFSAQDNGNVRLISVIDKLTGQALPRQNDIHQLGSMAGLAQRDLIIRAVYTSCDPDSLALLLGYDCTGYPDSLAAFPCTPEQIWLRYEPVNTRLETTVYSDPSDVDLCADRVYSVFVRNTGSPKVYDLFVDLTLRPGMVLGDTAWFRVGGRADSFMLLPVQNLGANVYRYRIAASDSDLMAKGLNGVDSTSGFTGTLHFSLSTNCNFTSGSFFLVRAGGFLKCGQAVNASTTVADPIQIKGVVKPYFSSLSFEMGDLGKTCDFIDSATVRFINLGPDTTGLSDQISFSFPVGLWIDTTITPLGHNAPYSAATYEDVNGESNFRYSIPSGIGAGDSCVFRVPTYVDPTGLSCGEKQIFVQAVIPQNVICVKDSTYCNIDVATSSVLITDTAEKSILSFNSPYATSTLNGGQESVDLQYRVSNSGAPKNAGNLLLVKIVYDQNGNGIADSGELVVARDSIWGQIDRDQEISETLSFSLDPVYGCALLLSIDDSNCVCGPSSLPIGPTRLRNAGPDTLICANSPIWIGMPAINGFTYRWNDTLFVQSPDSARGVFIGRNPKIAEDDIWLELTTNRPGCSSVDSVQIRIHPEMKADLADSAFLCSGDTIIIGEPVRQGVGNTKQYQWIPSTMMTRPNGPRTQVYPDSSTNFVLTAVDEAGCLFRDSTFVEVVESPIASFQVVDSCAGTTFWFSDESDYRGQMDDSLSWSFPDGTSYTLPQLQLRIDSAQTLRAALYVQNNRGCWDTTSRLLTVHPLPTASYLADPSCEGDSARLRATSTISQGVLTHQWTVLGSSYQADSIRVEMPNDTSFTFRLDVSSEFGCKDSLVGEVEIYDKPDVGIQVAGQCINEDLQYLALWPGTNRDTIFQLRWQFGDGATSGQQSGNHRYSDTGRYTVTLIGETVHGCASADTVDVMMHALPIPRILSNPVCLGDSVVLSHASTSAHGAITSVQWDLGSGYAPGPDRLAFLSTTNGSFPVGLRLRTQYGCESDTTGQYVVHYREAPRWNVQGHCENEEVRFLADPLAPDSMVRFRWVIEGDTFQGPLQRYDFPDDGEFWVSLLTTTNQGCESDAKFAVNLDSFTAADLQYDLICNDNQVQFSTSNNIVRWDLGDGSSDTRKNFLHNYPSIGTYDVVLYTENGLGCFDTAYATLPIENLVVPAFRIRDVCEEEPQWVVNLTNGNGVPLSQATFDMGDGQQRNSMDSFLYTYNTAGDYTVKLTVTTLAGCDYDSSQVITVHPLPTADFSYNPVEADILDPRIQFNDLSTGALDLIYTLSDGFSTSERNFQHTFSDSGYYQVKQWVRSDFGCLDSFTTTVFIDYAYILHIPNAFSPFNGDELNRTFKPKGFGIDQFEMEIYNRWGEQVFRSKYPNQEWDGTDALSGLYLYKMRVVDYQGDVHHYQGEVYLLD